MPEQVMDGKVVYSCPQNRYSLARKHSEWLMRTVGHSLLEVFLISSTELYVIGVK